MELVPGRPQQLASGGWRASRNYGEREDRRTKTDGCSSRSGIRRLLHLNLDVNLGGRGGKIVLAAPKRDQLNDGEDKGRHKDQGNKGDYRCMRNGPRGSVKEDRGHVDAKIIDETGKNGSKTRGKIHSEAAREDASYLMKTLANRYRDNMGT